MAAPAKDMPSAPAAAPAELPSIIPDANADGRRTLVLCFDGTGDQFDADNSNVIQFFTLLQKDDRTKQLVYYQAGIGTYTVPQIATPFMADVMKKADMAVACYLDAHVMEGYRFLMENYQGGDKICIFGFSRGAYTARSLAGMLHKVGLLPASNHQQVPFAYKMYTRCDDLGWKQSVAFKKAFSINVDIEFVGVWDTVCSVGLIPKRLPFVSSNTAIRYFRHALSLDERRAKFKANVYNRPTPAEAKLGVQPGEMPIPMPVKPGPKELKILSEMSQLWAETKKLAGKTVLVHPKAKVPSEADDVGDEDMEDVLHESDYGGPRETDVREVWFSGCHCDVGGGSVPNGTSHSLARIPLRWMIRECFLAKTGIRFHTQLLPNVGLDPATLYPDVLPRPEALNVNDIVDEHVYERMKAEADALQAMKASSTPSSLGSSFASTAPSPLLPPSTPNATLSRAGAPPMHLRMDSGATVVDTPLPSPALPDPRAAPLRATTLARLAHGAPGTLSEEEEDLADLLCPVYDQLALAPGWWILEVAPLSQRMQEADGQWVERLVQNWGGGREVPVPHGGGRVAFHRTVKLREEAGDRVQVVNWRGDVYAPRKPKRYEPKATCKSPVEYVA